MQSRNLDRKPAGRAPSGAGRRADLHSPSRVTSTASSWIAVPLGLQPLEPEAIYDRLKGEGMDFVTLTDLDSIEAAKSISRYPDVFLSEEISTIMPDDRYPVRILAYGISEADHERIQTLRADLFDLLAFLREREIAHALSRPLAPAGGSPPTGAQLERLLLLVPLWETRNGQLHAESNLLAERFCREATPALIDELSGRHSLPLPPNPLRGAIGGSDDIAGLDVGRTFTATPTAGGLPEFLADLRAGRCEGAGEHGSAERRAHAIYSLAVDAFDESPHLLPERAFSFARGFARTLEEAGAVEPERALIAGLRGLIQELLGDHGGDIIRQFASTFTGSMREALEEPSVLTDLVGPPLSGPRRDDRETFREINARYVATMTRYAESLRGTNGAPPADHVRSLGALIGFHLLLLPYLVSFFNAREEKRTAQRLARAMAARPRFRPGAPRIAVFTDTYYDTNGIVSILKRLEQWSQGTRRDITIVTAAGGEEIRRDGFICLPVITEFDLSIYRDYPLHFPSCLSVWELVEREGYDLIHVVTPGPLGVSALLAARLHGVPLLGSYHTQVPEYARILTGNEGLERVLWEFMRYFYSQCERVLAPSRLQLDDLAGRGFARERLGILQTGVDTRLFNPARRSDDFRERAGAKGKVLLLYVGRVSKEKGLDVMAAAYRRLVDESLPVRLAVVGEGPYRDELAGAIGDGALFTGVLEADELAAAYASSDIFIFPSATDTLGCVVLEAMASGLPVVVTDGGGARESVAPGETGLVARAGNVEDFAEKTRTLVIDPAMRRDMGVRARGAALDTTWDKAFEQLYADYEELSTSPARHPAAERELVRAGRPAPTE